MSFRRAPRNPRAVLVIEGECQRPTAFTTYDLAQIHEYYQVPDVSKIDERLEGCAVRLRKLIDLAGPEFGARWLEVASEDGRFAASLPLHETSRTALVIYGRKKGQPLDREEGGPVRFVIPFFEDKCAAVKGATRMTIRSTPGRDTRPSNRTEHEALHAAAPEAGGS